MVIDIIIKTLIGTTIVSFLLAWIYWEYNIYYDFKLKRLRKLEVIFKRCGIVSGILLGISLLIDLIIKIKN